MTIAYCGCTSNKSGRTASAEFQDKEYGKGMRVFTMKGKGENVSPARCTVCGSDYKKPITTAKKKG